MNALVVVASGLHLGSIGCYGNEWVQTPNLDRLAAEGIVFDQHYADQPDAAGAERAWRTGCYRFPWVGTEEESPVQEPASLLSLLAQAGIATSLVRDERIRSHRTASAGWQQIRFTEGTAKGEGFWEEMAAFAQALDPLASCTQWLLQLELGMLVPPWNAPHEFCSRYTTTELDEDDDPYSLSTELLATQERTYRDQQNRYAAAVTYLDSAVGQVLQEVEQRGLINDLLIVLTTDYGQKLGEEATRPGSRRLLHEELIHIPLLLRLPGKVEAGRRIPAFSQSVDLLPTLFDALGVPLPAVHGESLLPLARGQRSQIREYACAGLPTDAAVEWALRSAHWALLLPASADSSAEPELYVKPDDRWEVNNIAHHHLEWVERLTQTLQGFVEATRHPGPLRAPKLPEWDFEAAQEEPERAPDGRKKTAGRGGADA